MPCLRRWNQPYPLRGDLTHILFTAAKAHTLRRGVKEVVKALRKSPVATISGASASALPPGVVILAGDISPADIISHIPVLCEDHGVPYIFVPSRAELGAASAAKRPTSVVMVTAGSQKKKDDKAKKGETSEAVSGEDEAAEFAKVYEDLVRLVQKEVVQLRPYL